MIMPFSTKDRDKAMRHALEYARTRKAVVCIGKEWDSPVSTAKWRVWSYAIDKPPEFILSETIRYVLPRGEVTKLS